MTWELYWTWTRAVNLRFDFVKAWRRVANKICEDLSDERRLGFLSCNIPQFEISAPPTLHSHSVHRRKVNTKGKLKESKVFTCWILLLLWTRLRAWGCHWYKMWTFLCSRPGHGKAPGGTMSVKILLQPCDWSVDLMLWWKRAERLSLAIAGWNAIYTWHCESALPFPTQAFQPVSKPHCCNVTKIHQEVSLICVHLSAISNVPSISQ